VRSSAGGSGAAQPQQRRFRYHETLAGKYRLEKSLARGGMGWVFLATQLPLGRQVAVKVLTPGQHDAQFRQRFLLEASTCAKLQHPNIVTIHDYGESERGDLFMAMEYLNGSSLSYLLARTGSLPVDRVLRIALQVTRALRVAHKAGVVHRDLKPANIMLLNHDDDTRDFVKVVDFGLAKLFQDKSDGGIDLTKAGTMLGSPRYMAPEQIRNDEVDPRTDILARRHHLLHADGAAALHGQQRHRDPGSAPARPGAEHGRGGGRARGAARAGAGGAPVPRQGSGGALPDGG